MLNVRRHQQCVCGSHKYADIGILLWLDHPKSCKWLVPVSSDLKTVTHTLFYNQMYFDWLTIFNFFLYGLHANVSWIRNQLLTILTRNYTFNKLTRNYTITLVNGRTDDKESPFNYSCTQLGWLLLQSPSETWFLDMNDRNAIFSALLNASMWKFFLGF